MMSGEECYGIWAPDASVWSAWAKPVLFASVPGFDGTHPLEIPPLDVPGLPITWHHSVFILDLPRDESVRHALGFAARGLRPVPLFNGTDGPNPVVATDVLVAAIGAGAAALQSMAIDEAARPVFMLDSTRRETPTPSLAGRYDNRWIVLPQDFPSAAFLQRHGVTSCTLIQRGPNDPAPDLAHVLLRWQQGGVTIRSVALDSGHVVDPLIVAEPPRFRRFWYAAVALLGLKRANVGGFGSTVPEHQARSGFYG